MPTELSVVINTLNEGKRLPFALRSVSPWAGEIIVVDMHSDDSTVEIARSFGAKIVLCDRIGYVEPARALGVDAASFRWILVLDADEVIPSPLSSRLAEIVRLDEADAVVIPRVNWLLGAPLLQTGWGPHQDRHLRLFKRNFVRIPTGIHAPIEPLENARKIVLSLQEGEAIQHFAHVNAAQFVEKVNRYTTVEAEPGVPATTLGSIRATVAEFLRRFIRLRGYKDGWRGFYLSGLMAFYRFLTACKARELKDLGDASQIEALYRREAERLIAGYTKSEGPS